LWGIFFGWDDLQLKKELNKTSTAHRDSEPLLFLRQSGARRAARRWCQKKKSVRHPGACLCGGPLRNHRVRSPHTRVEDGGGENREGNLTVEAEDAEGPLGVSRRLLGGERENQKKRRGSVRPGREKKEKKWVRAFQPRKVSRESPK